MQTDRRSFHLSVIYGLWGFISAALAIPAGAYLLFPPKSRTKTGFVEVADLAQLPANQPEEVIFRRTRVDGWKVTSEKASAWVLKKSPDEVIAFAPQCTHLGCAYTWDERKQNFLCPCHTSAFSVDGKVLMGPAPRALDRYDIKVENGKLLLGDIKRA
jgi:menaquinol-cytochrome c reductase iron-sulfur subunit